MLSVDGFGKPVQALTLLEFVDGTVSEEFDVVVVGTKAGDALVVSDVMPVDISAVVSVKDVAV